MRKIKFSFSARMSNVKWQKLRLFAIFPAEPKGVNLLPHPANRHIFPAQAGSMRLKFISARGNQTCTNSIFDFSTRCSLFPILILPDSPSRSTTQFTSSSHHFSSNDVFNRLSTRLSRCRRGVAYIEFFFTTTSFSALRTRPSI